MADAGLGEERTAGVLPAAVRDVGGHPLRRRARGAGDIETFSSGAHINFPPVPKKYRGQLEEFPSALQLNGMDPPRHTYLRRIAQKAFTPATAKAREPEFRNIANRLVDDFIDRGRADLVDVFASKFPLYTAAAMLGLDPDPQAASELKQYATDAVVLSVDQVTDAQLDEATVRAIRFDRFMRGVIEERRKNLGDDVVSLLIKARDDESDQALNDTELVSVVTQSLVGGIDTTGALIARMVYMLLAVPERWDKICCDPGKYAATVVEETLRMHGPIRAVGRTTTRDVEVAGTTIPEGSFVLLHTGSASRDPSTFEDPERFDIERSAAELNQQLGLGRGTALLPRSPVRPCSGQGRGWRIPDGKDARPAPRRPGDGDRAEPVAVRRGDPRVSTCGGALRSRPSCRARECHLKESARRASL